jgi:hypothetical protein
VHFLDTLPRNSTLLEFCAGPQGGPASGNLAILPKEVMGTNPMSEQHKTNEDPRAIAREVIHDVNNFLTVCMTHGEFAMQLGDPGGLRKALDTILTGARDIEARMYDTRARLGRSQPAMSQVPPSSEPS